MSDDEPDDEPDGPAKEDEEQGPVEVMEEPHEGSVESFEGEHDLPRTIDLLQDTRAKCHGTWVRDVTSRRTWPGHGHPSSKSQSVNSM